MTLPDVTPPLVTICAWCPTFDRTASENKGASHGMCDTCCAKWHAEMDAIELEAAK